VFASRRKGSLVGLDITTSSVKLIELTESGRGYRVESYAAEPTPPNAINEKAIVDADAVGEAIRRAHKRAGSKTREAAIAINGDAAITKVIQMPKSLSTTDLEGQVELQVVDIIDEPDLAERDRIVAVPTLVKRLPAPQRQLVGDLADRDRLRAGLDLAPPASQPSAPGAP